MTRRDLFQLDYYAYGTVKQT